MESEKLDKNKKRSSSQSNNKRTGSKITDFFEKNNTITQIQSDKQISKQDENILNETDQDTVTKRRGRKSKNSSISVEKSPIESKVTENIENKARGRPRSITKSVLNSNTLENKDTENRVSLNETAEKKLRGRKPKSLTNEVDSNLNKEQPIPTNDSFETPKKKRGRKPKSLLEKEKVTQDANASVTVSGTKLSREDRKKKIKYVFDDEITESEADEKDKEDGSSDEDFQVEKNVEEENEEEESIDQEDSEEDLAVLKKESLDIISSKRKSRLNQSSDNIVDEIGDLDIEDDRPVYEVFDIEKKIEAWEYVLDIETKAYRRPIIPGLTDPAIKPFLSSKSVPPKILIYECPFCKRIFTYTLVFKSHLFTCDSNTNSPQYNLLCGKHPECEFKHKKKSEVIHHYIKEHSRKSDNDGALSISGTADYSLDDSDHDEENMYQSSITKQNQFEVSRYYYIDRNEFYFTLDYYTHFLRKNYKRLEFVEDFYKKNDLSSFAHVAFGSDQMKNILSIDIKNSLNLKLSNNNETLNLKPFETYSFTNKQDQFKMIYLSNQLTCLDWCPLFNFKSQYLACATFNGKVNNFSLKNIYEAQNLIYIVKFTDLSSDHSNSIEVFAILNKTIGCITSLKWRPAMIAQQENKNSFIGYLLASSSNGKSYVYCIDDMTEKSNEFKKPSDNRIDNLNVYEPKKQIILQMTFSCGQCTASDWSELNGAVQIAIGYANGTVAIFQINSSYLNEQLNLNKNNKNDDLFVYPVQSFDAHLTFIKTLKWSKINSNILATGCLYSRELKVWDIQNTEKAIIDYEAFVTDFAFSLHSNDLYVSKEANLKGENHLSALDLSYNIFVFDKDETRAHSSLFYSYSTMTSLDQSDYLNKLIICDNDGSILLSKSNYPSYWIQKHKLMSFSFAQIAKFEVTNKESETKYYEADSLENLKIQRTIVINLERITNNIKWNPNLNFQNWYACGSLSGFLFVHCINEINVKSN